MQPLYLLKRSFVRQSHPSDCGIACLAMIFHYNGKIDRVPELRDRPVPADGINLLELRNICSRFQMPCQCVEMEINYLRGITEPCILHIITEHGEAHYEVCYGSKRSGRHFYYIMADPAKQVYFLEEKLLAQKWKTRTALYFECLAPDLSAFKRSGWDMLWSFQLYPAGILIAIPILSLCSASFGVALSWLLQKGLSSDLLMRGHLIFILLALLLMISLFRSGMAFVRQYILVRINLFQHGQLTHQLIERLFNPLSLAKGYPSRKTVKDNLGDIQKIVNASSNFIAVLLSEGALIFTLICAVGVYLPCAALINFFYLALVSILLFKRIAPACYAATELSHLTGAAETILLNDVDRLKAIEKVNLLEERKKVHLNHHGLQLGYAGSSSFSASKFIFLIEALGTFNVITVFITCLYQLNQLMLSYSDLMVIVVLSYVSSSLMPKVGVALMNIADGVDASIQLKSTLNQVL